MGDHRTVGVSVPVSAKRERCASGDLRVDGGCENSGVAGFGSILLCERHVEEAEARERRAHWEETDFYLNMWQKIAQARNNDTLSRLLRYAQLEARADREQERKALERAIKAGR